MTATAVKDKPATKKVPKLATTGQIEMGADLFVRMVSALEHLRSSDDSRPILTALHLFVDEKGKTLTVYATDSYRMAKLVLPCDATPRLETLVRFDLRAVKALRKSGDVIVRVGQVGDFGLSSAGHWTGVGAHVTDTDGHLAFGSVISPGASSLDFDKLIEASSYLTMTESVLSAESLQVMAKAAQAFSAQKKSFGRPDPAVRIVRMDERKPATCIVKYLDHDLVILAMPMLVRDEDRNS